MFLLFLHLENHDKESVGVSKLSSCSEAATMSWILWRLVQFGHFQLLSMVVTALSCSVNGQLFVKRWICFCFCEPCMCVTCWLRGAELDRNVFFPSCLVIRLLPAGKRSDTSQLTAGGTGKSCKLQITQNTLWIDRPDCSRRDWKPGQLHAQRAALRQTQSVQCKTYWSIRA